MPYQGATIMAAGMFVIGFGFAMLKQKHLAFQLSSIIFWVIGICTVLQGLNMVLGYPLLKIKGG